MTPDDLRAMLDEERTPRLPRGAVELTLADRLDEDDDRLFGGLL